MRSAKGFVWRLSKKPNCKDEREKTLNSEPSKLIPRYAREVFHQDLVQA